MTYPLSPPRFTLPYGSYMKKYCIPAAILSASLLFSFGCSGGKNASSAGAASTSATGLIPQDCALVLATNFQSAAFREFLESPLAKISQSKKDSSLVSQLQARSLIQDRDSALLKALEKLGKNRMLVEPDKFFADSALCVKPTSADDGVLMVVYALRPGVSITQEVNELEADLRSEGVSVVRNETSGEIHLAATLKAHADLPGNASDSPLATADAQVRIAHLIAGNGKLVVSNDLVSAQQVMSGIAAPASFASNTTFSERLKLLPSAKDEMGVVYLNGTGFKLAENMSTSGGAPTAEGINDTAFFIGNARYEGDRKQGRLLVTGFASPPTDQNTSARLTELSQSAGIAGLDTGAINKVFGVSIAAQPLLASLSASSPDVATELKQLPAVSEILLGLALPAGASPFPDVYMLMRTSDPTVVLSTLKVLLGKQKLLSAWQSQTIAGTEVQLALSPMGVGAFLAIRDDQVLLATSRGAMEKLLTKGGKTPGAEKGTMLQLTANGQQILDLIKTLQGTLSMFTGGQTAVDLGQYQSLAQIGDGSFSVAVEPTGVRVNGTIAVVDTK